MSKFVIERQYLVPMHQHIVVEAESCVGADSQSDQRRALMPNFALA
jgi:hypothetical protein